MSSRLMGENNPSRRPEVRKKLRERHRGFIGRSHSEATKAKMRQRNQGRFQGQPVPPKQLVLTFPRRPRATRKRDTSRWALAKRAAPGQHTIAEWDTLKAQYDWTCPCCHRREPIVRLTEDHIVPLSRGGSDNIENIQPLCGSCNSRKHIRIIKYVRF